MADLTPEEWKLLIDQHVEPSRRGEGHGALETAQVAVKWGLTDELGPEFTPQDGELAIGTRVHTPNDGDGVVVRYAQQYEIIRTGPDSFDEVLHRRHVVQHEDGSLRAEAQADLTVL